MTADPALYDRLEQLRAAALIVRNGYPTLPDLAAIHDDDSDQVIAVWPDGATADFVETFDPESADLIAETLTALPDLIAAARRATDLEQRVQALAEELEGWRAVAQRAIETYEPNSGSAQSARARRVAYERALNGLRGLLDGGAGR